MPTIKEPVFGLDNFKHPKVLTDWDALTQSVLLVLFGRPGCYPSIPEIGMNIQQYRYLKTTDIDVDALRVELAYQCAAFNDQINSSGVDIRVMEQDGDVALLFVLPMNATADTTRVLIGVRYSDDGIAYNYDLWSSAEE